MSHISCRGIRYDRHLRLFEPRRGLGSSLRSQPPCQSPCRQIELASNFSGVACNLSPSGCAIKPTMKNFGRSLRPIGTLAARAKAKLRPHPVTSRAVRFVGAPSESEFRSSSGPSWIAEARHQWLTRKRTATTSKARLSGTGSNLSHPAHL